MLRVGTANNFSLSYLNYNWHGTPIIGSWLGTGEREMANGNLSSSNNRHSLSGSYWMRTMSVINIAMLPQAIFFCIYHLWIIYIYKNGKELNLIYSKVYNIFIGEPFFHVFVFCFVFNPSRFDYWPKHKWGLMPGENCCKIGKFAMSTSDMNSLSFIST